MPQRIALTPFVVPFFGLKELCIAALRKSEEQQAIPARAGDLASDGAQRPIMPRFELEALGQHLHDDLPVMETTGEEGAGSGQPGVPLRLWVVDRGRRTDLCRQEPLRGARAEVSLVGNLEGSMSGALAEAPFRVGLQAPGDAPKQILLVRRFGRVPEYLLVLFLQCNDVQRSQLFDRGDYCMGHVCPFSGHELP